MKMGSILALFKKPRTPQPAEPAVPAPMSRKRRVSDAKTCWWSQAQRDQYTLSSTLRQAASSSSLAQGAIRELERDGMPVNAVTLQEQMTKMAYRRKVRASLKQPKA